MSTAENADAESEIITIEAEATGRNLVDRNSRKGAVSIGTDRGFLRLRWSHEGKRYTLTMGLPDTPANRAIAAHKARLIEADLSSDQIQPGTFDPTLAKYRQESNSLTITELWERYTEHKRKTLPDPRSLEKYAGLATRLGVWARNKQARLLGESEAFSFRDSLLKELAPSTARERIGMLRSCWEWGMKRGLVSSNPWAEVRVKAPPKRKPQPFTAEEIGRILEHARHHPKYQHWADLIEFCLSVGCRPGEAAGLRWEHVGADCESIWIGESWGRGRQKSTKTNQARQFELFPELQELLKRRKPPKANPTDRVFTAPKGGAIDDHNFRDRVWKPILEDLGIPYRKPYSTRHTFISHALDQGWSVSEIAAVTGNSEETILRNYVGNPHGKAKVKRLF